MCEFYLGVDKKPLLEYNILVSLSIVGLLMSILDKINTPIDVKKLNIEELKGLAQEIRTQILQVAEKNGGHLASNLGIVETTIALYYAFDFEKDKLIFDVGHQCYAHKILSDRKDSFSTIRTQGGLSGFPDIKESVYDAFGVGHAGTALSAGLGYCFSRDLNNEDYFVVSVIGDGAIANGLNLEALTYSNTKPAKHIVILNDNGMSISKNKNGFYQFISKRTTRKSYLRGKRGLRKIFGSSFVTRTLSGFRNFIKRVIKKNDYFESHGFKYVGLVDGNDLKELTRILSDVKEVARDRSVFVHIKTTKGKGYEQAEEHAEQYHGVGEQLKSETGDFANALGQALISLMDKDKKIVAITAGMKDGTGLNKVEQIYPKNVIDVGIAEEFAVTYSAGMALGGLKPVVAIYSTFMQRAYDQILHDVCIQNLPVVFCLDRAGVVGKDGKTHQGVFDLSYLMHLPNMHILAPSTAEELKDALLYALSLNAPVAIRYPKNAVVKRKALSYNESLWERLKSGEKATIVAVGPKMVSLALNVAKKFESVGVINARTIKPLCTGMLDEIKNTKIFTLEENSLIGGFGAYVCAYYNKNKINANVTTLGIKDKFIEHGNVDQQLYENGLSEENLEKLVKMEICN